MPLINNHPFLYVSYNSCISVRFTNQRSISESHILRLLPNLDKQYLFRQFMINKMAELEGIQQHGYATLTRQNLYRVLGYTTSQRMYDDISLRHDQRHTVE